MGTITDFRTGKGVVMAAIDVAKTGPESYLISYSNTGTGFGNLGFTSGDPTKVLPYEALVCARHMAGLMDHLSGERDITEEYCIRNCDGGYLQRKSDEDSEWARELEGVSLSKFSDRELRIFEEALKLRLDELLEIHERRRAQ